MKINKGILARCAILVATIIWGSSFVVLKNALDSLDIMFILATRFLGAGVLLSIIFHKKIKSLTKNDIKTGIILGVCLFFAYLLQTIGLKHTSPGKNAFLTSVYCILVPFLFWMIDKKEPHISVVFAALLCFSGIGFVSLTSNFTISYGDFFTLLSGIFWALHIVFIAKFTKDSDPITLTILQFFACGLCSLVGTLLFETLPTFISLKGSLLQIAYLTVFCTGVTLLCQNWGQAHMPPSNAAILLTTESVFGVLFSVMIYKEPLTLKLIFGFALIFIANVISQTTPQSKE